MMMFWAVSTIKSKNQTKKTVRQAVCNARTNGVIPFEPLRGMKPNPMLQFHFNRIPLRVLDTYELSFFFFSLLPLDVVLSLLTQVQHNPCWDACCCYLCLGPDLPVQQDVWEESDILHNSDWLCV